MVSGAVFGLILCSSWKQSQWHMSLFMAGVHGAVHNNSQDLEAFCKQLNPARWIIHALEHFWYAAFVLVLLGWLKSVSSSAPANLSCAVGCVMIHWVPSDCIIVQHRLEVKCCWTFVFLVGLYNFCWVYNFFLWILLALNGETKLTYTVKNLWNVQY